MKRFLLLFVAGFLLIIGSTNAYASTEIYDDFSEPTLNLSKWTEATTAGFPDEHLVNTTEQAYHVAQYSVVGDRDIHLIMIKGLTDETVEYDLIYKSGEGNHLHNFGLVPYGQVQLCSGNCYIGYWNAPGLFGNELGLYHIKFDFNSTAETLYMEIKRPDNTYWTNTADISSTDSPYQILLQSAVGHNGIIHFDIDNVIITSPEPEPKCNCSELQEKISALEKRVGAVEAAISSIQNSINVLQTSFDAFKSLILGYLSNVPYGIKESMICGYMRDNELTTYSALGLSCEIKETNKKIPHWMWLSKSCKCVK